jgi:hypothetical protein
MTSSLQFCKGQHTSREGSRSIGHYGCLGSRAGQRRQLTDDASDRF